MARTMKLDQTDIYRMVVTERRADNSFGVDVYGPHDQSNQARDHEVWTRGPHRLQKQKLSYSYLEGGKLIWSTIRTEYRNGGEKVEWDA